MKIAVLTLTRDRLEYTQHCFRNLHLFAGCDFDHYVWDNGSTDGTQEWLRDVYQPDFLACSPNNIGITAGVNKLVDWTREQDDYDVVVKFDNDCELVQPNTLRDIAAVAAQGYLVSPVIRGLNSPPQHTGKGYAGGEVLLDVPQIGGIFLAAPAWVYDEFRCDERNDYDDDVQLCWWFRECGGSCGYIERFEAWHYETTAGQQERYPEYWERKEREIAELRERVARLVA